MIDQRVRNNLIDLIKSAKDMQVLQIPSSQFATMQEIRTAESEIMKILKKEIDTAKRGGSHLLSVTIRYDD